jgi:UDP:flavonoid glycosyltransferase YjiC (YdhE family)
MYPEVAPYGIEVGPMARIVFVTWHGGGNLVPALGIGRELGRRGHAVLFVGQAAQRPAVEAAGMAFTSNATAPPDGPAGTAAERQLRLMRDIWMNPGLADGLVAQLAREPADAVVTDYMLAGVLARTGEFGALAVVLASGLYQSVLPLRDAMLAFGGQLRAQVGLPPLDRAAMLWERKDLVLITTLPELDGVQADPAANIRYVGPVLDRSAAVGWRSPWAAGDAGPLILASFSTMPGQTTPALLQHVLDALAGVPARVLLTTGPVPPDALRVPANAAVVEFAPHPAVLPQASLMISHGGHGGVVAALAHGVPLLCIPGVAADQPVMAARVQALGVGKMVSADAEARQLRDATAEVLAKASYRQAARRLAGALANTDGAATAASVLESQLPIAGDPKTLTTGRSGCRYSDARRSSHALPVGGQVVCTAKQTTPLRHALSTGQFSGRLCGPHRG